MTRIASAALEFTKSGGCADAFFWATTGDDEHAVVVSVELWQPRSEEPGNPSDGKATLTGLVTEDGTQLPDVEIKTTWIGFYAG